MLSHAKTRICTTPARRRLSLWSLFALARQRRALAQMDEARLRDVGLTRDEANTEARRVFWDAPDSWSR